MKKVVIGLFVGVVLGVGGYLGYDKILSRDSKTTEEIKEEKKVEEEKKEEILDIYSDEVQNLYEKVHPQYILDGDQVYYGMELKPEYMNLDSYQKYAAYLSLSNSNIDIAEEQSITYDQLNQEARKIFGKSFNLEDKEYSFQCMNYSANNKTYTGNSQCGFGTGFDYASSTIYKAIQKNNKIEIYESVVYYHINEERGNVAYKNNSYLDSNIVYECNNSGNASLKQCIKEGQKYKFTFTLEDDNYILTNVEKVES